MFHRPFCSDDNTVRYKPGNQEDYFASCNSVDPLFCVKERYGHNLSQYRTWRALDGLFNRETIVSSGINVSRMEAHKVYRSDKREVIYYSRNEPMLSWRKDASSQVTRSGKRRPNESKMDKKTRRQLSTSGFFAFSRWEWKDKNDTGTCNMIRREVFPTIGKDMFVWWRSYRCDSKWSGVAV